MTEPEFFQCYRGEQWGSTSLVCTTCGAIVYDTATHDRWHARQEGAA